jgi:hypothetical protein
MKMADSLHMNNPVHDVTLPYASSDADLSRHTPFANLLSLLFPEFGRNIRIHNAHALHGRQLLLLILQAIMFLEMRNILRVRQILFLGILSMELLKMVNLILVLVLAVMSWAQAEIGQAPPFVVMPQPLLLGDGARPLRIEEGEDVTDGVLFVHLGGGVGVLVGVRVEAVEQPHFRCVPVAV